MSEDMQTERDRLGGRNLRGYVQLGAIVAAILVAVYLAQAPGGGADEELGLSVAPKPAVSVIKPELTDWTQQVDLTAVVSLARKARVVSEVSSRVVWISPKFSNGGSIPARETMIRIDPRDFELRVEAARAAVKEAEASVWRERARGEHDARVFARDYPGLELSERIRRVPSLAKEQAELERARVALKMAELKLQRTRISFPFDSRVLNASVELGEQVGPATPLGTVYRIDALQVEAPIEIRDLNRLEPIIGRAAEVRAGAQTFSATVDRVSSAVAPRSRLASVFLKFSESVPADSLPLPGSFAEVSIQGPVAEGVYLLPESAEQAQGRVWVIENGALKPFAPRTVGRTRASWAVEAFDAGDGIVMGTIPGARDGLAVELADTRSNPGAGR